MMGPQHALSGAAAWLTGSWVASTFFDYPQSITTIAIGTAVCAGGALLPDLDMSGKVTHNEGGSTVSRSFGVFSLFVAEVIEKISVGVYTATKLSHDPDRHNGHRTLTHTLPFAALMGFGATWLCTRFGKWAVLGILFVMFGFALRGLFDKWAHKAGWVIVTITSGAAAYGAYLQLPEGRGFPMIGLAVGVGCIVHLFGDIITRAGVPILWPIPTGRKMWRMVGLPDKFAIEAGSKVETTLLRTVFTVIALVAGAGVLATPLLKKFNIDL
ncbi:membrane protein [Catellatospora sp. TT07R-123]|uniref:metal-dependent hydrolase n=1 Tax=Catellatospora sp. TT07R-123 TaxID=2733863 RepID=UPI001B29C5AF|nr:metal-dependent hydrolase [Catellatospora sp. TT07R-123]GHJ44743.1 membrane protein [Catellatospora sp. TT07R-123]